MTPAELAALCAQAMPGERLTAGELARICYGPGDEVLGDRDGAVALRVQRYGGEGGEPGHVAGWLLLVAVRARLQGRGLGKVLVRAALERARERGARTMHLASAAPRYVWPGVELTNTRAGILCETLGFRRDAVGVNMTIDASFRRDPPAGLTVERERGTGALELARRAYPHWVEELDVALAAGTAFAARDPRGATVAFGCHSCNRAGWIGPMATDPDTQHRGIGSAVLGTMCADLQARGYASAEIAWVSNLRFYGKCGATVSRVFQGGHRRL